MARNTKDFTITSDGRDKGKIFRLTEKPAMQAEKWALKLLLACGRAGIQLPDDVLNPSNTMFNLIVKEGLETLLRLHFHDAEPLLDEMMQCVQYVPEPHKPNVTRPIMADTDIEEVRTLFELRKEIVELHVNFSGAGDQSTSTSESRP